jgi:hypothetical protein
MRPRDSKLRSCLAHDQQDPCATLHRPEYRKSGSEADFGMTSVSENPALLDCT